MNDITPLCIFLHTNLKRLKITLSNLQAIKCDLIIFSFDGVQDNQSNKLSEQIEMLEIIQESQFRSGIKIIKNIKNLGIRRSIPTNVSIILEEFGQGIFVEDDVIVTQSMYTNMKKTLEANKHIQDIFCIAGYSAVPELISNNNENFFRKSSFIESYAWATWKEKWYVYRDNVTVSDVELSIKTLRERYDVSYLKILGLKLDLLNVTDEFIDSWAYRWQVAVLINNGYCLVPRSNLIKYEGSKGGRHTKSPRRWRELEISEESDVECSTSGINKDAEIWTLENMHRGTFFGALELFFIRMIYKIRGFIGR